MTEADKLFDDGLECLRAGRFEEAAVLFKQARDMARETGKGVENG